MKTIIVTVMSPDRPGLVTVLSEVIVRHEGSWGQSSMANLAGQFAGILTVSVDEAQLVALRRDLVSLSDEGMTIVVSDGDVQVEQNVPVANLDITGHDQPGIVQDVARACSALGVNLISLETEVASGSMSGEPMFVAKAAVQLLGDVSVDQVQDALEALSDDLMVDVQA